MSRPRIGLVAGALLVGASGCSSCGQGASRAEDHDAAAASAPMIIHPDDGGRPLRLNRPFVPVVLHDAAARPLTSASAP